MRTIILYTRAILLMASMLLLPSQLWAEAQPWAEYISSSHELIFHYDEGKASSTATATYDLPTTNKTPGWYTQRTDIQKVTFLSGFAQARPVTCYGWFSGMSNLTEICGLENLNTSEVTSMNRMFSGCSKLTTLDLSTFYTPNVTDTQAMFASCTSLTSLDLSGLITDKVTTMWEMFYNCVALTELDISSFYTEKVKDMRMMFAGCKLLEQICVSDAFVVSDACSGDNMFQGCVKLPEFKTTSIGKEMATSTTAGGYLTVLQPAPWVRYDADSHTLTFHYGPQRSSNAYDVPSAGSEPAWSDVAGQVKQVVFSSLFARYAPTTCYHWFKDMGSLTDIIGLEYLETSGVTSMNGMFSGCSSLTKLDLSSFSTAAVNDMSNMFSNCEALTELDVSGFNTEKVTNMSGMFQYCKSLTELDLSSFLMTSVNSADYMFYNCVATDAIYVGEHFAVNDDCTDNGMFSACFGLTYFQEDKVGKQCAHYKTRGYLTLRRHFTVGEAQYNVDGYDSPTCYTDVPFTDGAAYSAPCAFTFSSDNTASYTRSVSNHWATLCLPFAFSADNNTARFYSVGSYTDGTIAVEQLTGTIAAGTPVLAYVSEGNELSVTAMGAAAVDAPAIADVLQGAFAQTEVKEDEYIIANDHFWNAAWLKKNNNAVKNVYVAPYRASLTLEKLSTDAKPNSISIAFGEDETTGVTDASASLRLGDIALDGAEMYDLQGRRLTAPQRGMIIVRKDGVSRKVVVR